MSVNTAPHHKTGFVWPRLDTPLQVANRPKREANPYDDVHAMLAADHEVFSSNLETDSPAHTLASGALVEYPETSSEGNLDQRCNEAIHRAVAVLAAEGTTRLSPAIIARATRVVKAALKRTRKAARVAMATAA